MAFPRASLAENSSLPFSIKSISFKDKVIEPSLSINLLAVKE